MEKLFYEEQSLRKMFLKSISIGIFIGFFFSMFLIILKYSPLIYLELYFIIGLIVLVFLLVLSPLLYLLVKKIFKNLILEANSGALVFGYSLWVGKWIVEIPYDEIKIVRLKRLSFIQVMSLRRLFFSAYTKYHIEVDWGKRKQNGFSIINHKEFFEAIKDKVPADRIEYSP